jgi:hypothetical protein
MSNQLKLDVVFFGDATGETSALYIDGELELQGDAYHDKIDQYINGYMDGLEYAGMNIDVKRHSLDLDEDFEEVPNTLDEALALGDAL